MFGDDEEESPEKASPIKIMSPNKLVDSLELSDDDEEVKIGGGSYG